MQRVARSRRDAAERGGGQAEPAGSGRGGSRADRIATRLRSGLGAEHVEVVDESHLHAGHPGAASGGGHFRVLVVASRFAGQSRIAAQRSVYEALGDMMAGEIHALSIGAYTPEEWQRHSTQGDRRDGPGTL